MITGISGVVGRSLEIGSMRGESGDERYPVTIWEANAFPPHWLGGWWSRYYSVMPRMPDRTKYLAPWVARRYRQQEDGIIEEFDHSTVEKSLSFGSNQRDCWKLNDTKRILNQVRMGGPLSD